jgi:hypothetical protein
MEPAGASPESSEAAAAAALQETAAAPDDPEEADEEVQEAWRARARPSTAPTLSGASDPAQTWGRAGHLTVAQAEHLGAMRRRLPGCDEEEVRTRALARSHKQTSQASGQSPRARR